MNTSFFSQDLPKIDWAPFIESLDWSLVRRARRLEDWMLLADTSKWLRSLPVGARPVALHKKFPRIANELCRLWFDANALADYFDSLLYDRRPGRQGFPALIQEELRALHAYSLCLRESVDGQDGALALAV